jgi:hypothetical protein
VRSFRIGSRHSENRYKFYNSTAHKNFSMNFDKGVISMFAVTIGCLTEVQSTAFRLLGFAAKAA